MEKLKNGLTKQQIDRAREIFKQVNLSAICRDNDIKYANINNVLRGTNHNIAAFKKVLSLAQKQILENKKALETLPL